MDYGWVGVMHNAATCHGMEVIGENDMGEPIKRIGPCTPSHTVTSDVMTKNNRGLPRPARSMTSGGCGELKGKGEVGRGGLLGHTGPRITHMQVHACLPWARGTPLLLEWAALLVCSKAASKLVLG